LWFVDNGNDCAPHKNASRGYPGDQHIVKSEIFLNAMSLTYRQGSPPDAIPKTRLGAAPLGCARLEALWQKARYLINPRRALGRSVPAMLTTPFRMTQDQERELRATLARLLQEHRDLDAAIEALQNTPGSDILQIQRLKKRKLYLRDRITFIEDQLTPDIIA
jgi:hypothetical protein